MSDPPKKFTFGFSKTVKKTNLVAPPSLPKEKTSNIQFIECVESKSIKLKNGEDEEEAKAPLVIPIIGPRKSSTLVDGKSIAEIVEDFTSLNPDEQELRNENTSVTSASDSIEAQAVREILQEGADAIKEAEPSTLEALPSADQINKEALQKESTLEDYESIPVTQFGLAMLRGMGWKPDEGIGKNKKLVAVTAPTLRPKGMGLGADKVLLGSSATTNVPTKKDEEQLKMSKGACVKIVSGMHKEQYAQVEGFMDETGRVILKMAIGGHVISVNEALLLLVSKDEYSKNSKVLNATKFNEFKKKEESGNNPSVSGKKVYATEEESSESSKKRSSQHDQNKSYVSAKKQKSQSPDPQSRKPKLHSRNSSVSPERDQSRKIKNREVKDESVSPDRRSDKTVISQSERHTNREKARKRSISRSPERKMKYQSPSPKRYRSRSRSRSRDRHSKSKKKLTDSDSDSKSHKKRKKKKKNKERRRARSNSSSENSSRSRSPTPKKKRKDKKSRRSRSKSPSSRRRR